MEFARNPYHTEAEYMHPFTTHSEYMNHMMQTDGIFSNGKELLRNLKHGAHRAAVAVAHPKRTAPYNPVQQQHERDRNDLLRKRAAAKLELNQAHKTEMMNLSHEKHINALEAKNDRHAKKMSNNDEILAQMKRDRGNHGSDNMPRHDDLMDDDGEVQGLYPPGTIHASPHSIQKPRGWHSSDDLASRNGRSTLPSKRYTTVSDYHPRYNTMDMESYAGDYHPGYNTMDMQSYAGDYHPRDTTTSMLPRLEYPQYARY
jgi:hypothetical protein